MHKCSQPNPKSFKSSGLTCIWAFYDSANTCPQPCEKQTKLNSFFVCCGVTCIYVCSGGGSGVTVVGQGSTTDGRQRLSGEGGKKEMSADLASHTHTHRSIGYALEHQTHTAHVSQGALSLSPPTEAGASEKQTLIIHVG